MFRSSTGYKFSLTSKGGTTPLLFGNPSVPATNGGVFLNHSDLTTAAAWKQR